MALEGVLISLGLNGLMFVSLRRLVASMFVTYDKLIWVCWVNGCDDLSLVTQVY